MMFLALLREWDVVMSSFVGSEKPMIFAADRMSPCRVFFACVKKSMGQYHQRFGVKPLCDVASAYHGIY